MRLICPNCGAQYEVSNDAVPENGRDVQCSNCGHTWFEKPGASVDAEEDLVATAPIAAQVMADVPEFDEAPSLDDLPDDSAAVDEPDFYEDDVTEAATAAKTEFSDRVSDLAQSAKTAQADIENSDLAETNLAEEASAAVSEQAEAAAEASDDIAQEVSDALEDVAVANRAPLAEAAASAPAARHGLESSVADILREEAEREQSVRKAEGTLETQTDIPMDPPAAPAAEEARSRIARLKGGEAASAAAVASLAATEALRKDKLPDIDEISSTLRTSAQRGETVEPPREIVEKTKRKGFRWGFWGIILLILLAVLVYLFSDMIIASVPAVEAPVTSYVGVVDGLRETVNGLVAGTADRLESSSDIASE